MSPSVRRSVGWFVVGRHNFPKGQEVTLPCFYRSTCSIYSLVWCFMFFLADVYFTFVSFATFMNYKEGMIFTVTLNSLAKIQCQPFPSLPRSAQLCFNHQVCRSVGWSVCHNLRKGREVTIPRSYQSTCYLLVRMSVRFLIQSWIQRIEKKNVPTRRL